MYRLNTATMDAAPVTTGRTRATGSANTWDSVAPCGPCDGNQRRIWANTRISSSPRKYTGVEYATKPSVVTT